MSRRPIACVFFGGFVAFVGFACSSGSSSGGTTDGGGGNCNCKKGAYFAVCGTDGKTYDAACGTQCVPVPIACQGQCPCTDGGGIGGSGGVGGSGGSGGSAGSGGGTGGSPTGSCPSTPPAAGSSCTDPWSVSSGSVEAHCTWGDDPRPSCRTTASCQGGTWTVKQPDPSVCSTP